MTPDVHSEIEAALAPWRGGSAKLWHYHSSFQRLVIRVEKSGVPGNLHIACSPCVSIRAPVFWDDMQLVVEAAMDTALQHLTYRLVDKAGAVEIVCLGLTTERNVPPVFT
jgi:hypothetical protein